MRARPRSRLRADPACVRGERAAVSPVRGEGRGFFRTRSSVHRASRVETNCTCVCGASIGSSRLSHLWATTRELWGASQLQVQVRFQLRSHRGSGGPLSRWNFERRFCACLGDRTMGRAWTRDGPSGSRRRRAGRFSDALRREPRRFTSLRSSALRDVRRFVLWRSGKRGRCVHDQEQCGLRAGPRSAQRGNNERSQEIDVTGVDFGRAGSS